MSRSRPKVDPPAPGSDLPEVPAGSTVNLTVRIPVDMEIRLHGLARKLGCQKRALVIKFLQVGMDRYKEGRRLGSVASDLVGESGEAA